MKRVLSTTILAVAVSVTSPAVRATPKSNTTAQQQQLQKKKQEAEKHEADIRAAQDHTEELEKSKQKAVEARTEAAEHNQQKAIEKAKLTIDEQHSKKAAAVHSAAEHAEAKRSQQYEAREKVAEKITATREVTEAHNLQKAAAKAKLSAADQRSDRNAATHLAAEHAEAKRSQQYEAREKREEGANNTEVKVKEHQEADVAARARRRAQLAILAHKRLDILNKQIVSHRSAEVESAELSQKALDNHAPKGQKDTSIPLLASASDISREHNIAGKQQLQQEAAKKAAARNNYEQLHKKYLLEQSLETARHNAMLATNEWATNHIHQKVIRDDNSPLDQWHKDVQHQRIDSNTP